MSEPARALPDTSLVQQAQALVQPALPPALWAHSQRTFLLARAYAEKRRIAFDEEGLCLAAIFHDLGLVPAHRSGVRAFPLDSSRALRAFLSERGVDSDRAARLGDAIEWHMQLFPRWSLGPEVGLLQVGAWMDVTGLRRWSVRDEARAIRQAHPRAGLTPVFARSLLATCTSVRGCVGLLAPRAFRD